MGTRRDFLEAAAKTPLLIAFAISPLSIFLKRAWGEAERFILPKGTPRESLARKNPAEIDPRNLDITPLGKFGTMGPTDLRVDIGSWRLEIDGDVENPLRLTYKEVLALPSIERDVLLICPGFFANYGRWKGVSIAKLLEQAGGRQGAADVVVRGPKSSYEKVNGFPRSDVAVEKVFLAYEVNGTPLPVKHGFPLRVVAEGYYGYDWIKYVYKVTLK